MRTLLKFFVILFLLIVFDSSGSMAQAICPKERTECTNHCRRYIDENSNDSCDLSEAYIKNLSLEKEKPEKVIDDKVDFVDSSTKKTSEKVNNSDEKSAKRVNSQNIKQVDFNHKDSFSSQLSKEDYIKKETIKAKQQSTSTEKNKSPYHVVSISVLIAVSYILSMILVAVKIIKKANHRKFWNSILLLAFFICGLSGLFLAIQINYDFTIKHLPLYYLFHVDVGIVMAILSIVHVYWHWKYYWAMIKSK